jgi:uncharacterized protein YdbL (DUF1318 family)
MGKLLSVDVTVVDEKTALENQVLGSYEEIGRDTLLLASVRSVDESGKIKEVPPISDKKRRAIKAMQRRQFNKDDIDTLKSLGCAGENNEGLLTFFETKKTKQDGEYEKFAKEIIRQESEDRLIIMRRIVATNENFSQGDLPKVQKIFASLNRDSARPGDLIQAENGEWIKKEKE